MKTPRLRLLTAHEPQANGSWGRVLADCQQLRLQTDALSAKARASFHAHPDDEPLLTGGTLARAAADGHHVMLITAT